MTHQRIVRVIDSQRASVECCTCGTRHTADRDEDGSASIEQHQCQGNADCVKMLCSECRTFRCDYCDGLSCVEHRVEYCGMIICAACYLAEALAFTSELSEAVQ